MFSIADSFENVSRRIQKATKSAGRSEGDVSLLAMTKTHDAHTLKKAMEIGLKCFGENYVSEALEKQEILKSLCSEDEFLALEWHFTGPVQSNKSRQIAANFDWVHSLDREKIARRLNEQRPAELAPLNVCIQVNIDDEVSKSGIALDELDSLAELIESLPQLTLRGLMCIPKADQDEIALARSFKRMYASFKDLQARYAQMDTLSMGMSGDIELAIENGSTIVRVGTALFGARAKPNR